MSDASGFADFDLPRGVIAPIMSFDVRLVDEPHPFELANRDAIAANWAREIAANPALFNGTMVLLSQLIWRDGHLTGRCHAVNYATMLFWRRNKGVAGIEHFFAFPALVARDNALVAIRMGKHTANPGMIYFAAGSFEPDDFVDGRVDAIGNMTREVREETGLDISDVRTDAQFHLYSINHATVLFRRYWLDEEAAEIAGRIERFVVGEAEPEIEGPVVIRSASDDHDGMSVHMRAIVKWHFDR